MEVLVCMILIIAFIWFVVSRIKHHHLRTRTEDLAKEFLKEYETRFGTNYGRARENYRVIIESVLRKQSSLGSWATRLTDAVFEQNDYIRNTYMAEMLDIMPEKFHQLVTVAIWGIIESDTLTDRLKIAKRSQDVSKWQWQLSSRNRQRIGEFVLNIIPNTL